MGWEKVEAMVEAYDGHSLAYFGFLIAEQAFANIVDPRSSASQNLFYIPEENYKKLRFEDLNIPFKRQNSYQENISAFEVDSKSVVKGIDEDFNAERYTQRKILYSERPFSRCIG